MNYLFIDKQNYCSELSGSQLRYLNLGKELVKRQHSVTIACSDYQQSTGGIVNFVRLSNIFRFLQCLHHANVIVVHGGGPWVHLSLLPFLLTTRRFIYDGYAFHWLEIYQAYLRRKYPLAKTLFKLYVHCLRWQFVVHAYDGMICANKRQFDYLRGGIFFSSRLAAEQKAGIVSLGCEESPTELAGRSALTSFSGGDVSAGDFLVGWIGGIWPWLELDPVIKAVADLSGSCPEIKLVFFGVGEQRRTEIVKLFCRFGGNPAVLKFLPHVPYKQRLNVWSGLDVAIVWAGEGMENDYASRTRNYDCITIGLPIIQNYDDQWGAIIAENDCGIVTDTAGVAKALALVYKNGELLSKFRRNIRRLQTMHSWAVAARDLDKFAVNLNQRALIRLPGIVAFFLLLPFMLVFTVVMLSCDLLCSKSISSPD